MKMDQVTTSLTHAESLHLRSVLEEHGRIKTYGEISDRAALINEILTVLPKELEPYYKFVSSEEAANVKI